GAVVQQREIEIGKTYAESDDFSLELREDYQIRHHDWLELLGQMVDFRLGERHESPVSLPRGVVQRLDQLHLGAEPSHVELAELDTAALRGALRQLDEPLGRDLRAAAVVRQQVLRLGESVALVQLLVVRKVVR